ncbi:MAG: pimeloyl-ACP methyl ester carboxylesterase [Pseudohongiellaceae bacterium]|jgi:pimeloyl-ACP methyl ester carboxylesterase
MHKYDDYWYQSNDGLKLYARNYSHDKPKATIVCIPGLTRNSADFVDLCEYLSADYRVIAVDLRGRGLSEYDSNPLNYHPGIYVEDIIALLDALQLDSAILIGTSLGGLTSMILAAIHPARVAAVIINDIGPETSRVGLERIKNYVCNPVVVSSWAEAVAMTQRINVAEYPNFDDEDWLAFAKNIYHENDSGCPVLNYDMTISVLIAQQQDDAAPPDLWPVFSLMGDAPLLLVRGQLSDILTAACVEQMKSLKPAMQYIEVANCGHAPLLTEPECIEAINYFLGSLE